MSFKEILSEVEEIYEEKLKEEPLVEVELENITPAFVWGWRGDAWLDPKKCLVEGPRPTAIAGKLRWWLRAAIAGAYYEWWKSNNSSKFNNIDDMLFAFFKDLPDLRYFDEIAATIMGKVSKKSKETEASGIIVQIQHIYEEGEGWKRPNFPLDHCTELEGDVQKCLEINKCNLDEEAWEECYKLACKVERVKLVGLGCKGKYTDDLYICSGKIPAPPKFYRFKLTIRRRLGWNTFGKNDIRNLFESLIQVFTILDGIGGAGTRGFGRLKTLRSNQSSIKLVTNIGTLIDGVISHSHKLLNMNIRVGSVSRLFDYVTSRVPIIYILDTDTLLVAQKDIKGKNGFYTVQKIGSVVSFKNLQQGMMDKCTVLNLIINLKKMRHKGDLGKKIRCIVKGCIDYPLDGKSTRLKSPLTFVIYQEDNAISFRPVYFKSYLNIENRLLDFLKVKELIECLVMLLADSETEEV